LTGNDFYAEQWMEFIELKTAKAITWYDHDFFGKYPAITQNQYGKGACTYFGTVTSLPVIKSVLSKQFETLGLLGSDQKLPETVKVKHGIGNSGKRMHYYYNFSTNPTQFIYPYSNGINLFTNQSTAKDQLVDLKPWDVAIIEEK
jgi:beta-galactosidase